MVTAAQRSWVPVQDAAAGNFISTTGLSAAEHNGAVHAFGVGTGGAVNHTRTFTGASWNVTQSVHLTWQICP